MTSFSVRTTGGLLLVALFVVFLGVASISNAQEKKSQRLQGYITDVRTPNYFEVNGNWIEISDQTQVGIIGIGPVTRDEVLPKSLHAGAYVEVMGALNKYDHGFYAQSVEFREDANKPISGVGVIDQLISIGPEPLIQADGYKIRITSTTKTTFAGGVQSLADLGTNVWVRYEGHRDQAGILEATSAKFFRTKQAQKAAANLSMDSAPKQIPPPQYEQPKVPAVDSRIDANGKFVSLHTKVRYSDSGGYCGWHKFIADPALEERVWHVGMNVVPAYQKQLPAYDPSKIKFAFYVVDEPNYRFALSCNLGVVLVPRQVIVRLKNDDQLAAILADGVAFNLQRQSFQVNREWLILYGTAMAADVSLFVFPEVFPIAVAGEVVAEKKILLQMEEQRGRIALALLTDAGYDPWEAPEAWRLLAPKKLPDDLSTLKYPSRSEYQFGILSMQYSNEVGAGGKHSIASVAPNR